MDRYDDDPYDDADQGLRYDNADDIAVQPSTSDEALEHLWNAAHELLRAVRMIVDAADEFVSSQRGAMTGRVPREHAPEPEPRVRRIDIDGLDESGDPGDRSSGSPGAPGASPR